MGRVLEVKCLLIELNKGVSFINLDDILVDLKLAPEVLEVPVPKYFVEDHARALEEREKLLDVLQLQAGIDPKKGKAQARDDSMTLESALRVVQLNERGRQGMQRALLALEVLVEQGWFEVGKVVALAEGLRGLRLERQEEVRDVHYIPIIYAGYSYDSDDQHWVPDDEGGVWEWSD